MSNIIYQCAECGLHYSDENIMRQCLAWCSEHKSCNLNITKNAIENLNNAQKLASQDF